uniref:Uncharacterized protein n=1 Tax=Anas zonorhyncha TaxID=75864 RepID=A0A8B9TZF2_9AVES
MSRLVPLLLLAALSCATKPKRRPAAWDERPEAGTKGCANLTLILDNWRFAITSQLRNLLLQDHHTVLPDYGRIRALSGALDGLYGELSALKERLGRLSGRFGEVEAFVEQLQRARGGPRGGGGGGGGGGQGSTPNNARGGARGGPGFG